MNLWKALNGHDRSLLLGRPRRRSKNRLRGLWELPTRSMKATAVTFTAGAVLPGLRAPSENPLLGVALPGAITGAPNKVEYGIHRHRHRVA